MTSAERLLADLRSRGVELETDGTRLRWRPAFLVTEPQRQMLVMSRATVIALLLDRSQVVRRCPSCQWPLDSANRCPRCFDRLCLDCGRQTGSYFIQRCVICGHALEGETS